MTWILDLDGVVWHGTNLLDGAADAISKLKARGINVAYLTNNSNLSASALAEKFASLGIETHPDDILSAHELLVEQVGTGKTVMCIAAQGLVNSLRQAGNEVLLPRQFVSDAGVSDAGVSDAGVSDAGVSTESVKVDALSGPPGRILDIPPVDAVIGGIHFELDYLDLSVAARALLQCKILYSANRDPLYPSASGMMMGTGSILAALESAALVKAKVIGKPEQTMVDALRVRFPDAELVVGDQIAVDGLFAQRAEIPFGYVLSGVDAERNVIANDIPVAHQTPSLAALVEELI